MCTFERIKKGMEFFMENAKLENLEAIALVVIISVNCMILSTSQVLVNTCASSSLLNVLLITLLILMITWIFCLLLKQFLGKDLLDISEFLGGKPLKIIIGLLFIAYFTFRTSLLLKKISNCLQIVYYPMTNILFIVSLFCIAAGIVATLRNNSIFKSAILIFPVLFITIVLVFMGNSKNFNFENIYPLLGNGVKTTFLTGISNMFAFCGLLYLYFIPSKLKNPEKITKISLLSIGLSGVFLLFSCASIMFLFGDQFSNTELFPLYVSVRSIEFGTFFQRLDSVFLFLCVLSFICALGLNTYMVIDILKNITGTSDKKPFIFAYLLTVFGIALCLKLNSTLAFLEGNVSKILFAILALAIPFIILVSANIKKKIVGGNV